MSKIADHQIIATGYDNVRKAEGSDVMFALLKAYAQKPLKDVELLDLGGGTGNYTLKALQYGIGHATLVDASESMTSRARDKLAPYGDRVEFHIEKVPPLPFKDQSFDAVMMNLFLNHLDRGTPTNPFPEAQEVLADVRRVLRPGGFLVITGFTPEQWRGYWFNSLVPEACERFNLNWATVDDIRKWLADCQFETLTPLSCMGHDIVRDYFNPEGPLDPLWRTGTYMATATPDELETCVKRVQDMKEAGTLHDFMMKNDKTGLSGFYLQAAIAK